MCGHTRDPVIYSKFHRNPFRGFGDSGGQNLAIPITLAIRFYNSLYYRTSRDDDDDDNFISCGNLIFMAALDAKKPLTGLTMLNCSIRCVMLVYCFVSLIFL